MKKFYSKFFMIAFSLAMISAFGYAQMKVLFIGRGTNYNDRASDGDLVDSLTAWGYDVTYLFNDNYAAGDATIYGDAEAVFINETVNSASMANFGVRDNYPLPLVCLEAFAQSNTNSRWAWTADASTEIIQKGGTASSDPTGEDEQFIVIKDNTHYITQNYNMDDEIRWSEIPTTDSENTQNNQVTSFKEVNVGFEATLAICKGNVSDVGFWNMVTVTELPNKVFMWGIHQAGLNGNDNEGTYQHHYGTQQFYDIIKRASDWTFGNISSVEKPSADENLLIAYPSPANGNTNIKFYAPKAVDFTVSLYNVTGQEIQVLAERKANAGYNYVRFNAAEYAAGVYFVKLEMGDNSSITKLIIQ